MRQWRTSARLHPASGARDGLGAGGKPSRWRVAPDEGRVFRESGLFALDRATNHLLWATVYFSTTTSRWEREGWFVLDGTTFADICARHEEKRAERDHILDYVI